MYMFHPPLYLFISWFLVLQDLVLSELGQVYLQHLCVVFKAQCMQGDQYILPVYGLPLVCHTTVTGLTGDKRDELTDTFLHALLRIFGHFRRRRECVFHEP